MQQVNNIFKLREILSIFRQQNKKIALVPTMGNLHVGHLSLLSKAQEVADVVVVSIFVNPTQFNNPVDLAKYPRTLDDDLVKLAAANCDVVFTPSVDELYPKDNSLMTGVRASQAAQYLCGVSRIGHFDGVVTVVSKLFNAVNPDVAIFGRKDYQQLRVISDLVKDLLFDIEIIGIDCVREDSGLALSSRNNLLTEEQRFRASYLYKQLMLSKERVMRGDDYLQIETQAIQLLQANGFVVDYFFICNADTLRQASKQDVNLLIAAAVFMGDVRLIDNVEVVL